MVERSPNAVLEEIAAHPRGDDLARLVHAVTFAMADERRTTFADGLAEACARASIAIEDAETSFGNVVRALEHQQTEGAGGASRALLGALLARGVALSPPNGAEAEARVTESLVWLAASTSVDALGAIDAALGDRAAGLWLSAGALLRRADAGNAPLLGRAGAIVCAAALGESASPEARAEAKAIATEARDPIVRGLLSRGPAASKASDDPPSLLRGELLPRPRGSIALVLLAVTGILFVMGAFRVFSRVALRVRKTATLATSARGITLTVTTVMLGRTLKDRATHVPLDALRSASREVRFPRLSLYVGVAAIALGSALGASIFVDGARAGSPELVGVGALVIAIGVALDYVLTVVVGAPKGRCRVVVVPKKGAAFAVGGLDPSEADAALRRLVSR